MVSRSAYRLLFGALVLASLLLLASGHLRAADGSSASGTVGIPDAAPPSDGVTVVATDSTIWLDEEADGPRQTSELVAFAPDGDVLYHNDTHDRYWDVDPEPDSDLTVLYTASDHLDKSECEATTVCTRNVVERVNLSTGSVTRLYSQVTPHKHSTRWHDVDRLDDDRLVVADIYRDRVFVVDVTSGLVEWEWSAQSNYDVDDGGPFPRDWTHLNDVEVLPDGRIMASVRNMDQVVFLDPETGMQPEWTLGIQDDHDVLHQQHNPDYIPPERGGPAVVVADSENNRVVEYQRRDGEWTRTWQWADAGLQWPRDADRLPDGNTLVADSNGDRVLEVSPDGEVVWSIEVAFPYEAERLSTGGESSDGRAAAELGLQSREPSGGSEDGAASPRDVLAGVWVPVKQAVPGPVLNAIVYMTPGWVSVREFVAIVVLGTSLTAWAAVEWRRSRREFAVQPPLEIRRR